MATVLRLPTRPADIVRAVHLHGQLSSGHITRLFFNDGAAAYQADRARKTLAALVKLGEIRRTPQRAVGGWTSGSYGHVYIPPGAKPNLNRHKLAISEFYVQLIEAERSGRLRVAGYEPEPGQEMSFGAVIPDAILTIENPRGRLWVYLEVDLATEHKGKIESKLVQYRRMYQTWKQRSFPLVLFATTEGAQLWVIRRAIAATQTDKFCQAILFDEAISQLTGVP
jgi:hypothetical protein